MIASIGSINERSRERRARVARRASRQRPKVSRRPQSRKVRVVRSRPKVDHIVQRQWVKTGAKPKAIQLVRV